MIKFNTQPIDHIVLLMYGWSPVLLVWTQPNMLIILLKSAAEANENWLWENFIHNLSDTYPLLMLGLLRS